MDPHLEVRSPGLNRLIADTSKLERVAAGFWFTEGPLWLGDHLIFSDIPNSRIVRWQELPEGPEVRTFRSPTNLANGLTIDNHGRLLTCEGATRRVTRTNLDGTIEVLADKYQGKRLNAPNDVIVTTSGVIYFSDFFWANGFSNPFGPRVRPEEQELPFVGVFRIDLNGSLHVAADDFVRGNGLALSPDEKVLYVDDTRRFHIRAFDVQADGSLANSRVHAELRADPPGVPDGMKVDREGNIYCTGPGGVWIVAPTGEVLGRILVPEIAANVAFGGEDWSTLFITASTCLYRIRVNVPGIPLPNRGI